MYERLKQIYDSLQDDESGMIFEKRLMYSLTGDKRYAQEMIHALIQQYAQRDSAYKLLQWLSGNAGKKVVIFGAGIACRDLMWLLRSYGLNIAYLCDNNTAIQGKVLYNISVISPEELKGIRAQCCVIVGVNLYKDEVVRQLRELGFSEQNIFTSDNGWLLGDQRQYFDKDIMLPDGNEVFVDGGALDGGDTLTFLSWCGEKDGKAYLFEPDEACYLQTCKNVSECKGAVVMKKGLWSSRKELKFANSAPARSGICESGDTTIQTISLDEVLKDEHATFIKMDIEGAELEALKGAAKIIGRDKPRLAICVYHKPEDIVSIPEYILRLNPSYRLYLRHYYYRPVDTVLYAV